MTQSLGGPRDPKKLSPSEKGLTSSAEDFKTRVTDKINEVMRLIFLQTKDRLDKKFGCFEVYSKMGLARSIVVSEQGRVVVSLLIG